MGVRPLNGLVSITECASRFEADTAVALLAASGIDAVVAADPAHAIAPHLVTDRTFSVLVRIAIADDAQQALVRGASSAADVPPAQLVRPVLPGGRPGPPLLGADDLDDDDLGDPDDLDESRSSRRPRWIKVMAWTTAASVVLPLLAGVVRTISEL